ncbi:flavin reductase family protein [Novosphingobium panipatense]|uniref:NADH-FMN oxidoreductase RutF, flavin reductase (DIM6/NTAB) family n=1 Tax=Novosphingobium panipatense TaxID=428991 RepID=A0ABY1Q6Z4_9SPHN|nr:flavin reductase family protein [Novosphingobium panipatense]SMP60760.1 NADH-FMN oxidoreductase RutF, flavin reductase (DIM6/NTAB) family [Novosphingobium panipatense]
MPSGFLMAEGYPIVADGLPAVFKAAMRRLAASVSIVVAQGNDGPVGIAATSVTSLTMDPPALLVCVNRSASLHATLVPTAPLSINLLSRDQADVAGAFGGGVAQSERFGMGQWQSNETGLPELAGAQANLHCVIDAMLAYGTHSIVIARVLQARVGEGIAPLIYQDGGFL